MCLLVIIIICYTFVSLNLVSSKTLDQFVLLNRLTQFHSLGWNKFFGHDYRLLRDASCTCLTDVRKGCGDSRVTFTQTQHMRNVQVAITCQSHNDYAFKLNTLWLEYQYKWRIIERASTKVWLRFKGAYGCLESFYFLLLGSEACL